MGPKATHLNALAPVIDHPGTQILGAFQESALVAMATLHLLPNVVWHTRHYALIENIVTRADCQRQGF